ncbi:LamG-like jellyroll fold domain-containing protein [Variovorax sp.]|uniref:LamG-like jellyroll fold domain-containing protein n=1 Tax=Variovorax sp. TaxID=1871043 RepID=UPI004037F968
MAAHRYWRARGFGATQGIAVSLSEFQLFAAGARVDAGAALTASTAPDSGTAGALQDDNLNTAARWVDARRVELTWDFGAGTPVDVDGARVGASSAPRGEFPAACSIWWSDDGVTWTRYVDWAGDYPGAATKTAGYFGWAPADQRTALQLEFVGADASTSFIDEVPGNVWTANGSAQIKTDAAKWGNSSGYFNGTSAFLSMPSKPALAFNGDFTIEVWFRCASLTNAYGTFIATVQSTFSINAIFFMVYGDTAAVAGNRRRIGFGTGGSNPIIVSNTLVSVGQWYRTKLVRSGSQFLLYVNDVLEQTNNSFGAGTVFDLGFNGTHIGRNQWDGANGYFHGHIGEIRLLRGVAEDGTIPAVVRHPAPTKALTRRGVPVLGAVQSALRMWPFTGAAPLAVPNKSRDYSYGWLGKGIGRIRGNTLDYVPPTNKPYRCRVRLVRDRDGQVVRAQWTAPDGGYDFQYIDELDTWSVWATYLDFGKRGEVSDGLTLANGKVELMA